jgi:hypothetical protein
MLLPVNVTASALFTFFAGKYLRSFGFFDFAPNLSGCGMIDRNVLHRGAWLVNQADYLFEKIQVTN